jgi:putative ABC transport system ATP-binding protein
VDPAALFTLEDVGLVADGRPILVDVSDHLHEGRCTAIVGPSGSGKSTLLRMLNRLAEPTSGRVLLRGLPLPTLDPTDLRRRVGLVAQQSTLLTGQVAEELRVGAPDLPDTEAADLLRRVALPEDLLGRGTEGLSGGERQRLCLARALAVRPEALLLDEPTSALDATSADAVDEVIRRLVGGGLTVVLVSHDLQRAAGVADDVLVLRGGRLTARGSAAEVDLLRAVSGESEEWE